jgi:hypothetical protein
MFVAKRTKPQIRPESSKYAKPGFMSKTDSHSKYPLYLVGSFTPPLLRREIALKKIRK